MLMFRSTHYRKLQEERKIARTAGRLASEKIKECETLRAENAALQAKIDRMMSGLRRGQHTAAAPQVPTPFSHETIS